MISQNFRAYTKDEGKSGINLVFFQNSFYNESEFFRQIDLSTSQCGYLAIWWLIHKFQFVVKKL